MDGLWMNIMYIYIIISIASYTDSFPVERRTRRSWIDKPTNKRTYPWYKVMGMGRKSTHGDDTYNNKNNNNNSSRGWHGNIQLTSWKVQRLFTATNPFPSVIANNQCQWYDTSTWRWPGIWVGRGISFYVHIKVCLNFTQWGNKQFLDFCPLLPDNNNNNQSSTSNDTQGSSSKECSVARGAASTAVAHVPPPSLCTVKKMPICRGCLFVVHLQHPPTRTNLQSGLHRDRDKQKKVTSSEEGERGPLKHV